MKKKRAVVSGIYCIENTVNRKKYIGQSKNIFKRWLRHKYTLNQSKHPNRHLQGAWGKYTESKFIFYILELRDHEDLDCRESYWIEKLNSFGSGGYNMSGGGEGSAPVSEETRERKRKMSQGENGNAAVYTEKQMLGVVDMLLAGIPNSIVFKITGVSKSAITAIKNRKSWRYLTNGLSFPKTCAHSWGAHRGSGSSTKYSQEKIERVIALIMHGERPIDIARKTGVTVNVVNNIKARKSWDNLTAGLIFPEMKPMGKYYGITRKRKKFLARINFHGEKTAVGTFNTLREAIAAYNNKAIELYGDSFPRLNKEVA